MGKRMPQEDETELRGSATKSTQVSEPVTGKRTGKQGKTKDTSQEQKDAIVTRISEARNNIQAAQIQQAKEYADAVTDPVVALATPLIGLRIVEKGVNALNNGGKSATDFLRSMPSTGITLKEDSISMIGMEDPLKLDEMDDPLVLMLMGS